MSTNAKSAAKASAVTQKSPASNPSTSGPKDPFLSKMDGPGVIVRFNADWARKCANDDTFAAFESLFDENVMPTIRPVVLNHDLGEMADDLQAALITHAAKKFVDRTSNLMYFTEKLFQKYWMSLSVDWQQRLIACEGYAAIKQNFDLLGLKTLLEATFNNPATGGAITRVAIENAFHAFATCNQFDRESMAAYYKRFTQIVRYINGIIEEARRPTVPMQVQRLG